jgi:hypothetical protein
VVSTLTMLIIQVREEASKNKNWKRQEKYATDSTILSVVKSQFCKLERKSNQHHPEHSVKMMRFILQLLLKGRRKIFQWDSLPLHGTMLDWTRNMQRM